MSVRIYNKLQEQANKINQVLCDLVGYRFLHTETGAECEITGFTNSVDLGVFIEVSPVNKRLAYRAALEVKSPSTRDVLHVLIDCGYVPFVQQAQEKVDDTFTEQEPEKCDCPICALAEAVQKGF